MWMNKGALIPCRQFFCSNRFHTLLEKSLLKNQHLFRTPPFQMRVKQFTKETIIVTLTNNSSSLSTALMKNINISVLELICILLTLYQLTFRNFLLGLKKEVQATKNTKMRLYSTLRLIMKGARKIIETLVCTDLFSHPKITILNSLPNLRIT